MGISLTGFLNENVIGILFGTPAPSVIADKLLDIIETSTFLNEGA